jgi:Protein of unknown function (DUF3987)
MIRSDSEIAQESVRISSLQALIDSSPQVLAQQAVADARTASCAWPQPTPLPKALPPVEAFDPELLPDLLRKYVADIAERMQCPPDFPAVALLSVLSAAIGRRCGILPKRRDRWEVIPNLWAAVIGPPGVMKSPPLVEVMRPLNVLQTRAFEQFQQNTDMFKASGLVAVEAEKVAKDAIRKALKEGRNTDASELADRSVQETIPGPTCRRYVVNDSTVEKLGELLSQNPHGLLLFRDELTGFFRTLERQGHEADRAFYLECWNGNSSYTYDRIGRGTVHISGVCLAILGAIQPGPLTDLVRGMRGGGDDGLLQRFQLAVWPDISPNWQNVDREPDIAARDGIAELIDRLVGMSAKQFGIADGAIPLLHFHDDAQELFDRWRADLEQRLRSGIEHPAIEAHLAKYKKLVPSIALILHLVESNEGTVSLEATERAIAWAGYLESHARRIYAPAVSGDMDAAHLLADKILEGRLGKRFALRDVYRNGWTGLSAVEVVQSAARVLVDFDWLSESREDTAGRTAMIYTVNPNVGMQSRGAE